MTPQPNYRCKWCGHPRDSHAVVASSAGCAVIGCTCPRYFSKRR